MKFALFLATIVISFSATANANDPPLASLDIVAAEHELLQYRDNGVLKGPTIEILKLLLQNQQLVDKTRFLPWARALLVAKTQPNTLVLSIVRTKEREPFFHWITKVSNLERAFISLKSNKTATITTFEQAKSKLTVVVRDSYSHRSLLKQGFSAQQHLYVVSNIELAIDLLLNNKVELLYTDPEVIEHYFEKQKLRAAEMVNFTVFPETSRSSYIALNKESDVEILEVLLLAHQRIKDLPSYHFLINN
ncbi:substrate-binding periplasmic protein [Thalassotalea marina]|uniref:ABC transporter substrate-binding protein n=1 Tax=Thalassotalea marina TaxID=1673741 RepID=A0A919BGC1_9GAMM|nr:transporter substrate-binding domain-containing protein [Thalassotalea marina]GHF90068.1 ABC transporter substrate-binding protein [Thalassotalea marina]